MAIKTKLLIDNEWVDGEELSFSPTREDWNTYKLEDGTELRIKPVLIKAVRTEKWHPQRNDPIYHIQSSIIVDAVVPESLKKRD